jgi:hypothetical protein
VFGCSPSPNILAGTTAVLQCVETACVVCDVAGTDVPLLRFNRGRAELEAVADCGGCLSVARVNWTQTELRKLHVG